MKMRKTIKGILAILLVLGMLLPGLASAMLDCGPGNHSWSDWAVRPEPTCTEKGSRTRWCNNCMQTETEEVPALGHSYGDWKVTKEPTCTEKGSRTRTCSVCGDTQTEAIAAKGHSTAERIAKEATCAADGVKETYCTVCGTVTGTSAIKATGNHAYGEWITSKEPTCTEKGSRTRSCSVCGDTQTEAVAAKGHSLTERITKEATCGAEGKKETYCTVCGTVTETATIKKTGNHSYGDWIVTKEATCNANGSQTRTCSVCGNTETESIPKASAHQYGDWVITTQASCASQGLKTKTCLLCGLKQTEAIPKLEHEWGEWTITKEATCTKDGMQKHTCQLCGASKRQTIPKLGHSYGEWEIIEEATDHSKGKRSAVCERCGKKATESFYPEGTLYKGGDNPESEVKDLQTALAALKLYKGKISGKFDSGTANAVSKFEKSYLGIKGDGIGWPKVKKALLPGIGSGEASYSDTSGVKLLLEVEQVSPVKDYYASGDQIIYQWTLTNLSKKDDAMSVRLYMYKGMKPDKKKDTEIAQPETLIPGEKMTDTWTYTVTDQDVLDVQFTVGFIARCTFKKKNAESNKAWFNNIAAGGIGGGGEGSSGGWTPPEEQQLAVSKKVMNKPANGAFFVKGEKIKYQITVANTSNADVEKVILTDQLVSDTSLASFDLKAKDIKTFAASYQVKAADIPAGEILNTVIASYTGSDGKLKSAKASAKAPADFGTGSLHLYKTAVSIPENGLFYLPGEIVSYEITIVNNTGKVITDIKVYDELNTDPKEPIKQIGAMKKGASVTVKFKHHTSKWEAKTGKVINTATATYVDPSLKKIRETSNVCIVPAGLEDSNGVMVEKVIVSTPENGKYYEEAEEIRYMINVTNNTVKDIPDLDVRDCLAPPDANGFRTAYAHETLAAGETKSYPFSFIPGPADVENTTVTNIASVWWTVNGTDYFETFSDPVVAPTAIEAVPRTPKAVKLDGATCENPLTALGEGVAEHDVTECEAHTATAADAKALMESRAYSEAKDLWTVEIDEMYAEWIEKADAEGARNAEDEKAAWAYHLSALESSLSLICDSAEAEAIAAEEQMNRTVRLCYELHSAPETRSDSLEGSHTAASGTKAGNECSHETTYLANGSAHVVDSQCETHNITMQLTERLLEMAADDEDRAAAWQRTQGNWLLQLNRMYDAWYLSSDDTQRAKIAADRISFDRLIEARRKTLADLYPDDPATAAEVLANMIMERTELICRLLHNAGILKD